MNLKVDLYQKRISFLNYLTFLSLRMKIFLYETINLFK